MFKEGISLIVFIILISVILLLLLLGLVVFFLIRYQIRHQKFEEEVDELKEDKHRELLANRIAIQEEALRSVSLDLHDNVSHKLSLIKLNLGSLTYRSDRIKERLKLSTNTMAELIDYVRNVSHSLNIDHVEQLGLANSILREVEFLKNSGKFKNIVLNLDSSLNQVDTKRSEMVVRIIQEAISNILKHAKATQINIDIKEDNKYYYFHIQDNGIGIKTYSINTAGLGMKNMKDRAKVLGGNLDVQSISGKGVLLSLKIPRYDNR
jgi:signal transduction histidine kinase